MGRNSTLQPMSEFGGGGLNLIVCQLVDCKFCKDQTFIEQMEEKKKKKTVCSFFFSIFSSGHLKVVRLIFIIQMNFLLKHRERIPDEEVCDVLRQQLVNS